MDPDSEDVPGGKGCILFPGFFGVLVQVFLGMACFGSLLVKWYREHPPRLFGVFMKDSSKQIIGSGCLHTLNIICAMMFTDDPKTVDQCNWYWINIMMDTTLGTFITYKLLKASENYLSYTSGKYANNSEYGRQICIWLLIVSTMKGCMIFLFIVFNNQLEQASVTILEPFDYVTKSTKLLFVMVVTPFIMNTVQLWITDTFLKAAITTPQDNEDPMWGVADPNSIMKDGSHASSPGHLARSNDPLFSLPID